MNLVGVQGLEFAVWSPGFSVWGLGLPPASRRCLSGVLAPCLRPEEGKGRLLHIETNMSYRDASLIRNRTPLGPYRRPMPVFSAFWLQT